MATKQKPGAKPDQEQQPERKPLLELSTLAPERPFVNIDDHSYELRLLNEFGAQEHQEYSRDSGAYDALWNQEKRLTKVEADRMERLLERLFEKSLVDPDLVREQVGDRLTAPMKREIVLAFSNAPLLMRVMAQMDDNPEKTQPEDSSTTVS